MVRRALLGFGRFWYQFLVGDDWTVAAVVVSGVAVTFALHELDVAAWWLPPLVVVGVLALRLRRASEHG